MNNVVAVDVGHSAVKLAAYAGTRVVKITVPSFVCPAFELSYAGRKERMDVETIKFDGKEYFFGETARIQGQMTNPVGTFDNWIDTPEHSVLLLGALRKAAAAGVDIDNPILVLGLPTNLFRHQKEHLKEIVGRHLKTTRTIVMPQPVGAYQGIMLSEDGLPNAMGNTDNQTWGVIDVGYYTTDFLVIEQGHFVEDAMDSCSGMHKAAESMVRLLSHRGIAATVREAEQAMISRAIREVGGNIDVSTHVDESISKAVAEVRDTMARLMSKYARQMDGLVVAGGGAEVLFPYIQQFYKAAVLSNEPRFAVADGMRRFGLAARRLLISRATATTSSTVGNAAAT